jgi:hypothetical protein
LSELDNKIAHGHVQDRAGRNDKALSSRTPKHCHPEQSEGSWFCAYPHVKTLNELSGLNKTRKEGIN